MQKSKSCVFLRSVWKTMGFLKTDPLIYYSRDVKNII